MLVEIQDFKQAHLLGRFVLVTMPEVQNYTSLLGFDLEGSSTFQNDSSKSVTLGVDMFALSGNCPNGTLNLSRCDSILLQVGIYFAKLILPPGYQMKFKVYEEEYYMDIFGDLQNGTIDAFPFEVAMLVDNLSAINYFWPTPVISTGYYMYSSMRGIRDSIGENPMLFLTAPFTKGVWMCTFASAICVFFLAPFIFKSRPRSGRFMPRNVFFIIAFAFAFLANLYSSQLKALLTQQPTSIPFNNLYDLSKKVETGSLRLIMEDKQSLRWNLLTEPEDWRPGALQALYDAVQSRGEDSALLLEPNMSRICYLLETSTEYVYFGYEEIILASCGSRLCLWKYKVNEYPEKPVILPVSKFSILKDNADLAVHAVENYRSILTRRRWGGTCLPEKMEKELIGMRSLLGAVFLLIMGLGASTLILIIERLVNKRQIGFFHMAG